MCLELAPAACDNSSPIAAFGRGKGPSPQPVLPEPLDMLAVENEKPPLLSAVPEPGCCGGGGSALLEKKAPKDWSVPKLPLCA